MALVKVFLSFTLFLASYGLAEACYKNSDCPYRPKCCIPRFLSSGDCSYSCIGNSCSANSDCGGESVYCCNNICRSSCLGYSCFSDSDCGGDNEYCCNYSCQEGVCGLAAWLIVVIVLSVLGFVATIVSVVLCAVCAHRRRTPGLVVTHAPSTVPATATAMVGGSNVNYVQGPPPPYYPPAQKPQA